MPSIPPLSFGQSVLVAAALAALIAGVAAVFQRVLGRFWSKAAEGSAATAVGIGLGFLAGYLVLMPRPALPPAQILEWLPYFTLAAIGLGVVEGTAKVPAWLVWSLRAILAGALLGTTLYPLRESWGLRAIGLLGVGSEALILLVWGSLESLAARSTGARFPALMAVLGLGLMLVAVGSSSLMLALLAMTATAALGATTLASLGSPRATLARGGVSVAVVLLAGITLNGYFLADMPASCPFLLAAAPVAAWGFDVAFARRSARWPRALLSTVAVLVLVGAAVWIAKPWSSVPGSTSASDQD